MTVSFRLLHIIDLRNIGGVERMFSEFIAFQTTEPVEHIVLTDYPKIASAFQKNISCHAFSISCSRQFGFLTIPKKPRWLRIRNRERLIHKFKPNMILVWNQFTDYRDCQSDTPSLYPTIYYEHGFSWYNHSKDLVEAFFQRISGIFAVSYAAKRMLQLKHNVQPAIQVFHNALRPELKPSAPLIRKLCTDRPIRLGSAARMVPLKCLGILILTVAELHNRGIKAEAWIAGEGPQKAVLTNLVHKHNLQDNIHFLGLIDNMTSFYQEIDIYILPSMHETFPLACIEAQAWGVPVICANIDGLPEANPPQSGGICLTPDWDIEDYKTATGASVAFASQVYDPINDSLTSPKLLSPDAIADSVCALIKHPDCYHSRSQQAFLHANTRSFKTLCQDLYQAMYVHRAKHSDA